MAATRDAGGLSERTQTEIFATILTKGPLSRREISEVTGLSQSTITKAVKPLVASGYVLEEEGRASGPGRPVVPLRVNRERHYLVGVKVAGDEIVGVVTDPQAEVLATQRRPLGDASVGGVVARVAALTDELLDGKAGFREHVAGLGVGLAGHVDGRTGTLRYSPFLGWRDVPLASLLEEATGLTTVVENDVNALAIAEHWFGAGRDLASFAVVTVGAGVGCGLVIDHELVHGATGVAGELGHVVVEPDGSPCRCGNRGCLETVASDGAILAAIAVRGGDAPRSITEAAAAARAGDQAARAAFADAGRALGRGIATLVNIVNPSRIVLSGEGIVASDLLLDELKQAFARHAFASAVPDCDIVTRPLGDETWARGAASVALRRIVAGS